MLADRRIYSRSFNSAVRLQPTAPSGRNVEKLLAVLKMAVREGLECCCVGFHEANFLVTVQRQFNRECSKDPRSQPSILVVNDC